MAKKKQKAGGRTTPKGTRPGEARAPERSPVDDLIDDAGRDLRRAKGPLDLELFGSALVGMVDEMTRDAVAAEEDVPPVLDLFLVRCTERRDEASLLVAAGLSAVLEEDDAATAREVVTLLSGLVEAPPWLPTVGQAEPTRAWVASDVFGDADSLILGFRHPDDETEHALVLLVDHNLDGQVRDAWVALDAAAVAGAWLDDNDGHESIEEVPVEDGLRRAALGMVAADTFDMDDDLRDEGYAQHRALVWARLDRAGYGDLEWEEPDVSVEEREQVVDDFLTSEEGGGIDAGLARLLVDLRAEHEGRPLRWSPQVVEELLLDQAALGLDDGLDADALPDAVRAFVRWAGGRTGLHERFVEEVVAAVATHEPAYREIIAIPDLDPVAMDEGDDQAEAPTT